MAIKDHRLMKRIIQAQRNEITEHQVYNSLVKSVKDENNRQVLTRIAADELDHYKILRSYTRVGLEPQRAKVLFYRLLAKMFGSPLPSNSWRRARKAHSQHTSRYPASWTKWRTSFETSTGMKSSS